MELLRVLRERGGLGRQLVIQTAGTLGLNVSTVLLNFGVALLLARLLGADGLGAFAFALAWATVFSVPAALGLGAVVTRLTAAYEARAEWGLLKGLLSRANAAVVLASLVACLLGAGIAWALKASEPDVRNAVWIGLPLIPIMALTMLRQAAISGLGRVVLGRTPEALVGPVLFLLAMVCVYVTDGGRLATASWAVVIQDLSMLAAFGVGIYLLARTLPVEVKRASPIYATWSWARSALPLLFAGVFWALNAQIGTILLGVLAEPTDVGVYSIANRVALLVSFLYLGATYPLMPVLARLFVTERHEKIQRTLTTAARGVMACSVPVALVLFVAGGPILGLFGPEFRVGGTSLAILAAGELFNVGTGFAGITLVMAGREAAQTWSLVAGTVVNAALTAGLIPVLGLEGAALGAAGGLVVTNLLASILLWRRLGLYAPAIGLLRFGGSSTRRPEGE